MEGGAKKRLAGREKKGKRQRSEGGYIMHA
jgi:hypothetical protein